MRLYRIADSRYEPESGDGARRYGSRWNSPGRAVIYSCASLTGAMLEMLVHTGRHIPKHQVCVTFDIPDTLSTEAVNPVKFPGWDAADPLVSRAVGDAWLTAGTSLVLLVPSVVFAVERNALINPAHPDYRRLRVVDVAAVRWDERLFAPPPHR